MLPKPIDGLTFSDVAALVDAGLREGRTLDFKQALVGGKDDDKREFLADVSALANTAGGDIVFGITEAQGEATGIPGIELADPDAEILRLETILRSGLEPRLPRVELRWLPSANGTGLLIVRTPRSYLGPHRVTFRDHGHFYSRTNAGKARMDVAELRGGFLATEGLHQSIRRFRNERLGIIEADDSVVSMWPGPKVILHVVPLEAFASDRRIDITKPNDILLPLGADDYANARWTLEGLASLSSGGDEQTGVEDYAMLFRTGAIEAVSSLGRRMEGSNRLPLPPVERDLISSLGAYRAKLAEKDISMPLYVFVTLTGVRGNYLGMANHRFERQRPTKLEAIILPEVVINDAEQSEASVLRPIFDQIWNAFGYERAFSFDAAGEYVG